jgi:hypothetical protein
MNVSPDIHPLDVPGGVCVWMIVVHISNGVLMFVWVGSWPSCVWWCC